MNSKQQEALKHILDAFEPLINTYTDLTWVDEPSDLAAVLHDVLDLSRAFITEPTAAKAIDELIKVRDTCVRMLEGYRELKREIETI